MAIEILNFKPFSKNTLRGFVDLKMSQVGLEVRGCTYHEKNDKRWIGLPAREYKGEDGKTTWANILKFKDEYHWKFQKAALQAIDKYQGNNG